MNSEIFRQVKLNRKNRWQINIRTAWQGSVGE